MEASTGDLASMKLRSESPTSGEARKHRCREETLHQGASSPSNPVSRASKDASAAPGISKSSGEGANNTDQVPLWSQEPLVNQLAIHLIIQDLEQREQQQQQQQQQQHHQQGRDTTLDALVNSALGRMEQQGTTSSGFCKVSKSPSNWKRTGIPYGHAAARKSSSPEEGTCTTASESVSDTSEGETKMPAKRGLEDVKEDYSLHETTSENDDAHEMSGNREDCSSQETMSENDDTHEMSGNSSTRQEYLLALQQHLQVLQKRGQVSSVIPSFLQQSLADSKQQSVAAKHSMKDDDHEDHNSICTTLAVRTAKRRRICPTKQEYYEDLASEFMSHLVPPIPTQITIPGKDSPELEQHCPVDNDSDLSVSLCSSDDMYYLSSMSSSSTNYSSTTDGSSGSSSGMDAASKLDP